MTVQKFNSSFIIFLIIAVWYAVGNFAWWQTNTPILPFDIAAVHFLDVFQNGWLFNNAPLLTWIMRAMLFVFPKEYFDLAVIFINYIFFLIPLYFIYKLGAELKDKETGNIAMVLFALTPAVYGMSRQYGHQDYHIIAAMTFNIYCLFKTDYFRNRKWSIIYGVSAGLGLLIKDQFLAYFFAPFVYVAAASFRQKAEITKIINIFLSAIILDLITNCHYSRPGIIDKIIFEPVTETVPIFSFDSIRAVTAGLWENLLSPPLFILFIAGLIWFIRNFKNKYKYPVLSWILVPWLIILFMPHFKLPEYEAGFIPAMILIAAIYLTAVKQAFRRFILPLVIIVGILQYFDFSYGVKTNLFDCNMRFKNHKIMYYDKYNKNIMYYDREKTKIISSLIKYIKIHYPGNTFYVWDFTCDFTLDSKCPMYFFELMTLMNLNDIPYVYDGFGYLLSNSSRLLSTDIIINIGSAETVRQMADIYDKVCQKYPVLPKISSPDPFEKIQNLIDDNYRVIDVFYLNNIVDERYKVTLSGLKTKFNGNEMKQ